MDRVVNNTHKKEEKNGGYLAGAQITSKTAQ